MVYEHARPAVCTHIRYSSWSSHPPVVREHNYMVIEERVSLKEFTTMRVGGVARFFVRAHSVADLKDAVLFSEQQHLPYFVLGGGSNIVFSDTEFPGVVIKSELKGVSFSSTDYAKTIVTAGAGEVFDDVIAQTVGVGCSGLENLSAIPGTVGGAVVGNIGAYGKEIKDSLESVDVFDTRSHEVATLPAQDCQFSYRESIFKKAEGKHLVVVAARFRVGSAYPCFYEYADLAAHFAADSVVTAPRVREAVCAIRAYKLPDWRVLPTAGSFFKNPIVSVEIAAALKEKFPALPQYKAPSGVKVSAAYLIDHVAQLRGVRRGDVGIFEKQALVIVNYGNATQEAIQTFAEYICHEVFLRTGVSLEREVVFVGV